MPNDDRNPIHTRRPIMFIRKRSLSATLALALIQALCIALAAAALGVAFNALRPEGIDLADAPHRVTTCGEIAPQDMPLDQASTLHTLGQAVFVDARPLALCESSRIVGALCAPWEMFDASMLAGVSQDTTIVVYGDSYECSDSRAMTDNLKAAGFAKAQVLAGGWPAWLASGLPVE